ncbi:AraC family transcriptional regulator [Chitinophaga qingshengii]|uniref:AraC family transcriptional regulator n=1 Tax=Chitinophaga qingshengii TaxID=1569794 RepID=A0ABR7TM53_9BACT|nr:helix-turn-helix domain-containing protein [Chitinophaga qingshengii]MBC9930581.1 AraC family transcriptional regulator [Chitinophaga qingshengii]
MFNVQTFRPHQRLRDYLLSYQSIAGNFSGEDRCLTLLPHFIQSMWLNLGTEHALYNVDQQEYASPAMLTGPRNHIGEWRINGETRLLTAHFRPGSWSRMFKVPAEWCNNHAINLYTLLGKRILSLTTGINECSSPEQQIQLLESWLLEQLTGNPPNNCDIEKAIQLIFASHGNITIRQLETSVFLTKRTLERAFLKQTGLRLKMFCRLVRFRKAIDYMLRMRHPQWSLLAHKAGYCDQTHFINEFRYFTHHLPHQFSGLLQAETDFVTFIR